MNTEITDRPMSERLPEYLFTSIHEALGAASMCWIPQPGSQVFDSNRAVEIALELCRNVADWHEKEMGELTEARKVIAEAKQYALITAAAAPDEACPYCEYYEGIGTKLCWFHEALAHYTRRQPVTDPTEYKRDSARKAAREWISETRQPVSDPQALSAIEQCEADLEQLLKWACSCDVLNGVRCAVHRTFPEIGQRMLDNVTEIAARDAEIAALKKQLETLQHNYRVSFDREEQLNEELNDLTMAIVQLFSPATARRIYSARAARGDSPGG